MGYGVNNLICILLVIKEGVDIIYFIFYMDIVVFGNGIKLFIEDGYIKSDGMIIFGVDDKVGLVVMLEVIIVLKEENIVYGKIEFIIIVGEESGLVGVKVFDFSFVMVKFGYVLDSDGKVGDIIVVVLM